jgi:deoxyribodipyrimidine photo-lyase
MEDRVRQLNSASPRVGAEYVLYWSQMNRRVRENQALAYAITVANGMNLPVLFYEGLTCSYPAANDRLHTFILEGVPGTARELKDAGIGYVFHLRRRRTDPDDAFYQLASKAAVVVTDDYPAFVARRHNERVPKKLDAPYYVVDASCVVPMSRMEKREYAAYTIRPKIRRILGDYLKRPEPGRVLRRWKGAVPALHTEVKEGRIPALVAECEINHAIAPSAAFRGGSREAARHLRIFLTDRLRRYASERNEPAKHATSNLSPYLHFGHIGALDVAMAVREHAAEHQLIADEFLEELIIRRELAFNFARFTERPDTLENLPDWALKTLRKHARDRRPVTYSKKDFETGATHDDLWNATQKELLLRGKIHGYYRMYWGKKIIEWSETLEEALEVMVDLHDRYALDGRDPNTYTNILWCFGLHDRPWGEREIFGMVRYMSLDGMMRKTDVGAYLREIGELWAEAGA